MIFFTESYLKTKGNAAELNRIIISRSNNTNGELDILRISVKTD